MYYGYAYSMSDDDKVAVYVTWSLVPIPSANPLYVWKNGKFYQVVNGVCVSLDPAQDVLHRYATSRVLTASTTPPEVFYYTLTE